MIGEMPPHQWSCTTQRLTPPASSLPSQLTALLQSPADSRSAEALSILPVWSSKEGPGAHPTNYFIPEMAAVGGIVLRVSSSWEDFPNLTQQRY